MSRLSSGLVIACLTPWLVSCASTPTEPTTRVEVRTLEPPATLTAPCPRPELRTKTNGELAQSLIRYVEALRACNGDKAALRAWVESQSGGENDDGQQAPEP